MYPEGIDYKAVLADMEEKRAALDAAIENMKRWLGIAGTPAVVAGRALGNGGEIPSDAFFAMSIPDAIAKYLRMVRGKKATNDIVDALEKGGITHSSKNFRNTVSTALYREDAKADAEIVRVAEGEWGLTEWYPGIKAKRAKKANDPDPELVFAKKFTEALKGRLEGEKKEDE